ncbi:MAG: hypothetical protein ABIJ83_04910 [Patescibacteria group bacterium]
MATEITIKNLNEINLKPLALNSDFGKLKFEKSFPYLQEIQGLFKELDDLDYENNLLQPEINEINNSKNRFIEFLNKLQNFEIGVSNSQQQHDGLENEIENFYNDTIKKYRLAELYLQNKVASKSKDKQELQKQQKMATQAEKEYKELSNKLKDELGALQEQKTQIISAKGSIAATRFGQHFSKQSEENKTQADNFLNSRNKVFNWLIGVIIGDFVLYVLLFVTYKIDMWPKLNPEEFFTTQYAVVKIALITVLFYSLSFFSKHYKINSNLVATNKHRQNVADTLVEFLATNQDDKDRDIRIEMIKQGTNAMFRHVSLGYVNDKSDDEAGPVQEIINYVTKSKNEI